MAYREFQVSLLAIILKYISVEMGTIDTPPSCHGYTRGAGLGELRGTSWIQHIICKSKNILLLLKCVSRQGVTSFIHLSPELLLAVTGSYLM